MHGTRSGGSAPAPGPTALQPSEAEPTANVQAIGATVPRARRIPLPKVSELTQLNIKVPSVRLTPRGCLTKSKRDDALVVRYSLTREQRYELHETRVMRTRLGYDSYQS